MPSKIVKNHTIQSKTKLLNLFLDSQSEQSCLISEGYSPGNVRISIYGSTGKQISSCSISSDFTQAIGYAHPFVLFTRPNISTPGTSLGVLTVNTTTGLIHTVEPTLSLDLPEQATPALRALISRCLQPENERQIPTVIQESSPDFELISNTTQARYHLDCRWQAEYLEVDCLLFISCYICIENGFEHVFCVINTDSGTMTEKITVHKEAKGIGEPPFFKQKNQIWLLSEKTEINIFNIL